MEAFLRERPRLSVIALGGLTVLAADAIGVGEVALALGAGYAAYRVLRRKASARQSR